MVMSSTTRENLVLDAGNFYVGAVDIGATVGGSSWGLEQEIVYPELDGARGPVEGTGKITREIATLVVRMTELTIRNLALVVPGVDSSSDATSEYTDLPAVGYLATSEYQDVHWTGETMDGKNVDIYLFNAAPVGGVELAFTDTEGMVYEITWQAFYDPTAPSTRVWKILTER